MYMFNGDNNMSNLEKLEEAIKDALPRVQKDASKRKALSWVIRMVENSKILGETAQQVLVRSYKKTKSLNSNTYHFARLQGRGNSDSFKDSQEKEKALVWALNILSNKVGA